MEPAGACRGSSGPASTVGSAERAARPAKWLARKGRRWPRRGGRRHCNRDRDHGSQRHCNRDRDHGSQRQGVASDTVRWTACKAMARMFMPPAEATAPGILQQGDSKTAMCKHTARTGGVGRGGGLSSCALCDDCDLAAEDWKYRVGHASVTLAVHVAGGWEGGWSVGGVFAERPARPSPMCTPHRPCAHTPSPMCTHPIAHVHTPHRCCCRPSEVEFLENLHTAAAALQAALPKVLDFIAGKEIEQL
eukprot:363838-Chlamydomonas_euryale.AAC.5